jgi:hypothetical protein
MIFDNLIMSGLEQRNEINTNTNTNTKNLDNEYKNVQNTIKKDPGFLSRFHFFRRSKTEDNVGFINRQMPAYWYDGKN